MHTRAVRARNSGGFTVSFRVASRSGLFLVCIRPQPECVRRTAVERFRFVVKPLSPPFKSLASGLKKPPQVRLGAKKSECPCKS